MPTNERPGVYSAYEVTSAVTGSAGGGAVGVAARAENGTALEKKVIGSYAAAVSEYGAGSNMAELIRLLLLNGASEVRAAPAKIAAAPAVSDYEAAFAVLQADENVKALVCDSRDAAVHAAMKTSVMTASESCKYRIGVVEKSGTVLELTAAAFALNCERMVMVSPETAGAVAGSCAAAVAGAIAGTADPALPLSGAELFGLGEMGASYSDSEINTLVRGGVTSVERAGTQASVVRAVTTRSQTGGAADATWRELTTILIVDDVIPTIRSALRSRFARSKNTAQTRGAIRTQVLIELENKLAREIIDDYGAVTVKASDDDPTVCEVSFEFTVTHGLNQIHLTAHITV